MEPLFQGQVALVTGSASGIGRAIARAFAREGARVVVADINEEGGNETVELIQQARGEAVFVKVDLIDEEQVKNMVQTALDNFGSLDVACNNAALSRGYGPTHQFEKDVFDETVNMCLTNTWLCMKHQLTTMLEQGKGAIVNISSNASLRGQAYNSAYASAKSGVNTLTRSSAVEYASKGVRINAVSPGVILTPGLENHFREQPQAEEELKKKAPMKRIGNPEEIAEAVIFLASDRASYITGQLLSVDGGGAVN